MKNKLIAAGVFASVFVAGIANAEDPIGLDVISHARGHTPPPVYNQACDFSEPDFPNGFVPVTLEWDKTDQIYKSVEPIFLMMRLEKLDAVGFQTDMEIRAGDGGASKYIDHIDLIPRTDGITTGYHHLFNQTIRMQSNHLYRRTALHTKATGMANYHADVTMEVQRGERLDPTKKWNVTFTISCYN